MKRKFRIEYTDPETQERKTVEEEFKDTPTISARMWAEDAAYAYADKRCDYTITELK